MQFAGHLRDNFFPGCYIEVSTNGNGAHVFLIVDKTDWADPDYNAVLKGLDAWLKCVLAETGIVLDDVEIKGTSPWYRGTTACPSIRRACSPSCRGSGNASTSCGQAPVTPPTSSLAMPHAHPVEAAVHAPKVQKMRQAGSLPARSRSQRLDRWLEVGKRLLPSPVHSARTLIIVWW